MPDHEIAAQTKKNEPDRRRASPAHEPQPPSKDFSVPDMPVYQEETPFLPPVQRHAEMLSRIQSDKAKERVVLQLQRTYGNSYVQRVLDSVNVQARLNISSPGDPQEQEADRVADNVVQTLRTNVQRQPEEEEEPLQAKAFSGIHIRKEEAVQSQPGLAATDDLEHRITAASGHGQNLPDEVKKPMEQAFGRDFGEVQVHADGEADDLNLKLNARAFTRGRDVFFRQGEYSPGTLDGQRLLAHELAHVVQQNASGVFREDGEIWSGGVEHAEASTGMLFRQWLSQTSGQFTLSKGVKFVETGTFASGAFDALKQRMMRATSDFLSRKYKVRIQSASGEPRTGDGEFPIVVQLTDWPESTTTVNMHGGAHGRGAVGETTGDIYELGQATETEVPDVYLAHEGAHLLLGANDEYADAAYPARTTYTDHSLMGNFYAEGTAAATIHSRHFQYLVSFISAHFPDRNVSIVS